MTTSDAPVLLACAHGTSSPSGRTAVQRLVDAVAAELPDVEVVPTWVDVQTPDLAERTEQYAGRPAVVVPLLLSAGYHVYVDVAEAVAADDLHRVSAALGPDRALARLLADGVPRTVVTRGLEAALLLARVPDVEVVVVGGQVRPLSTVDTSVSWQKAILIDQDIDMASIAAMARKSRSCVMTSDPRRRPRKGGT